MPKLSKKEINQRLIRLRNLERLYPLARKRIDLLEEQVKLLQQKSSLLEKDNAQYRAIIEAFKLRIEELEKMVFGKSKKKDKEQDIPKNKRKWFNRKKLRHPSTYRREVPKEKDITNRNNYPIVNCPDCGTLLQDFKWITRFKEDIRQLEQFHQLLKQVEKQSIQSGLCPHCQKRVSALPIPSQTVVLGDNIRQFVCYCNVILNLSFEKTKSLIKDLTDIKISDGEISNILEKEGKKLLPQYHKLTANIRAGPASHYDETGWKVQKEYQGRYGWVMTGTENQDTVFRLGQSRGQGNALKLKGNNQEQVGISDDYGAYKNLFEHHQLCWAHPIRKLRDLANSEQLDENKQKHCQKTYQALAKLHQNLKEQLVEPFELKKRTQTKQNMIRRLSSIAKLNGLDPEKLKNIKLSLFKNKEKYFTCLLHQDVPTTNNKAERALRHLILKRKSSFGSKTQKGAWTMSILCSVLLSLWWSKPDNFFKEYSKLLNPVYA